MSTPRPGGPALSRPMVIAIDGPAGAGKSTVTRQLAERLGILFLDTGAMYRAATVGVLHAGIDADDGEAVARWVEDHEVGFGADGTVQLDGEPVPREVLRSPATTREVWRIADNKRCRAHLVRQQQALVRGRDAVIEGRDATTVICPDAQLKVYLDASPLERARRRLSEWQDARRDHPETAEARPLPSLDEIARDIHERDKRDSTRTVGALKLSDDAVHLMSDGLAPDEVIARIMAHAVQRQPFLLEQVVADQLVVGRSRAPGYVKVADGGDGGWQLGLTNPTPERMPGTTRSLTRNRGGRQAGTLVQGQAILALAGRGEEPGHVVALPMLPQTWYVIEPGAWHASIQAHGTICAWAEPGNLREEHRDLSPGQLAELGQYLHVLLPR